MADFNTTNANFFSLVNVDANFIPRSLKNSYYLPPSAGLIGAVKADGTTTAIDADGTIRVIGGTGSGGVTGLAATPTGSFLTGQIRLLAGNNITLLEDPVGNTITISSTGSEVFGEYIAFTGSATGGANQQFVNANLSFYASDATKATILVNGVGITPVTNYTISGTTLTIIDYLSPNALIQVIEKPVAPSGGGTTSWTTPNNIAVNDIFTGFSQLPVLAGASITTTGLATVPGYWDSGAYLTSPLAQNTYGSTSNLPYNVDWQAVAGDNRILLRVANSSQVNITTNGVTLALGPASSFYSFCYHPPYGFVGASNNNILVGLPNGSPTGLAINTGLTGNGINYATLGSNGVNCVAITSAFGNTVGQVFTSPTPQTTGTWTQQANAPVLINYSKIVGGQDGVLMAVGLPMTFSNSTFNTGGSASFSVSNTTGGATTTVVFTHSSRSNAIPVGCKINVTSFNPSTYNLNNLVVTASTATTTTVTYPTAPGATVTTQGTVYVCPVFIRSTDNGVSWSVTDNISGASGIRGGFGLATNGTGTWVSVGNLLGSGGTNAYSTDNGITWQSGGLPGFCTNVEFANGYFVATSRDNLPPYYSTNGTSWTRASFNPEISYLCASAGINGNFVAIGSTTSTCNALNSIFVESQEQAVPNGTYRNLGSVGHTSNLAMWVRTA